MMEHLPMFDSAMLMSAINCLLRDKEFDNLDDICGYYDVERSAVEGKLAEAGFNYDAKLNKVV